MTDPVKKPEKTPQEGNRYVWYFYPGENRGAKHTDAPQSPSRPKSPKKPNILKIQTYCLFSYAHMTCAREAIKKTNSANELRTN